METNIEIGLTEKEVKERKEKGKVNYNTTIKTKSIGQILESNICTLFNAVNLVLAILVISVRSYKNVLFMGTIICNTLIGIIQEIRSKHIIDKLSLVGESKAKVIRNGKKTLIKIDEIVKDDIILFESGNQIVTDSIILKGTVGVNESLITGEVETIRKQENDELLSGSYIVSGSCIAKVIHVGEENYTYKISKDAKYIKPVNTEIMNSLNLIIKLISYIIIPIGIIFFIKQRCLNGNTIDSAVVNTVAALIAIIPDGLMLLTSTVMALSVINLSRHKVLVQQLYCIENLARVDTICFDKTGTLTKGTMQVVDYIGFNSTKIDNIIKEINYNLDNHNPTMTALVKKYGKSNEKKVKATVEFSSERKWSGLTFSNNKTYILGASEYIIKKLPKEIKEKIEEHETESRVILLAKSEKEIINEEIPKDIEPLGIFILQDEIRKESKRTIEYFEKNGVDVKIISGDNPKTVSKIAKRLGISFYDKYVDTTDMTEDELKSIAEKYSIFGRVTPIGKKILIKALQENKHTVAMTGDGVNDVLALRQSDCAISVKSGSDAARNVSELVLLNSNFEAIPQIVNEGRRTINNIERSASLYITKTLYSMLLIVLFMFVRSPYPFIPIQLTLTNAFTIGIPSLILALEPNNERVKGNFFLNVVTVAFPTAITIITNIILLLVTAHITNIPNEYISTLAVMLVGTTGFMHIYKVSKPLNLIRTTLLTTMIISFTLAVLRFESIFSLSQINKNIVAIYLILFLFSYLIFDFVTQLFEKYVYKKEK